MSRPATGRGQWRLARASAAILLACVTLPATAAKATAVAATWSPASTATGCATAALPRIVFPSADPHTASGTGALLWSGDPTGCGAAGVGLAPIDVGDAAGPAQPLRLASASPLGGLLAASGTGDGRLVLVTAGTPGAASVLEGRAGAPFNPPSSLPAVPAPLATATSYLGDTALATVNASSGRIELRLQRHAAAGLSKPLVLSPPRRPVSALAVGLDYRGDALIAWAQDGWIRRRVLRADGRLEAIERIARTPPAPHLQVLISDDNRGILAWTTETSAGASTITRVYLDASLPGVHFGRAHLLEQFRNPPAMHLADGTLRLVRLASEAVMMAWTGIVGGRYVVRAAAVSLGGVQPSTVISDPATDSVLADLATGPHNEGLALWVTAPRPAAGSLDPAQVRVMAARGVAVPPGVVAFAPPETVGGPGAIIEPRAAIDPATDTALAVWQSLGPRPGIAYSARRVPAAPRRSATAPVRADRPQGSLAAPWLGAPIALLAACGTLAVARGRRRRRRVKPPRAGAGVERAPADRPRPLK